MLYILASLICQKRSFFFHKRGKPDVLALLWIEFFSSYLSIQNLCRIDVAVLDKNRDSYCFFLIIAFFFLLFLTTCSLSQDLLHSKHKSGWDIRNNSDSYLKKEISESCYYRLKGLMHRTKNAYWLFSSSSLNICISNF